MMELAVHQESPELHLVHHKRVVGTLVVSQTAVEVVDLPQSTDVSHHYIQHL